MSFDDLWRHNVFTQAKLSFPEVGGGRKAKHKQIYNMQNLSIGSGYKYWIIPNPRTLSNVSPLEFSEVGYLLLPSRDMAEILLKRHKSSIQPTNKPTLLLRHCNITRIQMILDITALPILVFNYVFIADIAIFPGFWHVFRNVNVEHPLALLFVLVIQFHFWN